MPKKAPFLGIIPARGGSKGISRKNIKPAAGKPLIAWSIEAARSAELLDDFVVSTEDAEIAAVCREYGGEVIDRPEELATDEATSLAVIQHVLSVRDADAVVLLQPTSPVRRPGLIDDCIREFRFSGADNLATGYVCKLMEYGSYTERRQDLEGFFHDDGNIYVVKSEIIKAGTLMGKKAAKFLTAREENIEIDDEFDFWMNEQILLKRCGERSS